MLFRSVVLSSLATAVLVLFQSNQVMNDAVDTQFTEMLTGAEKILESYTNDQFGKLSISEDGQLVDESGESVDGKFEYIDALTENLGVEATLFKKENNDYVRVLDR